MYETQLNKRLASIQKRIDLLQNLMAFVKNHPEILAYSKLKQMSTGTGLEFEEKGYIRSLWQNGPRLRLERHIGEGEWDAKSDSRIVSEDDISGVCSDELARILKEE